MYYYDYPGYDYRNDYDYDWGDYANQLTLSSLTPVRFSPTQPYEHTQVPLPSFRHSGIHSASLPTMVPLPPARHTFKPEIGRAFHSSRGVAPRPGLARTSRPISLSEEMEGFGPTVPAALFVESAAEGARLREAASGARSQRAHHQTRGY